MAIFTSLGIVFAWLEATVNPYLDLDVDPLRNCDRAFKPRTELKHSNWKVVDPRKNEECKARCHTRKGELSNNIGNWTSPGPVLCEILEAVCLDEKKQETYGYLHSQIIPTPDRKLTVDTTKRKQFDVIVILFDSLSYSQAKRSLPRTLSYFTNHMEGVMFPYMNKIGDNSRPNGVGLWFGKSLEKLDRTIFEEESVPADWTEHYFCSVPKDNEISLFQEFGDHGYKVSAKRYKKKFGWIWAINLGHNTENGFGHADKDFQKFLVEHRKQLDESFVFLLGDHGLRFGGVRSTFVGGLDVNNPITALSIPKSLRKTTDILKNMNENARKIQTHYDTRATMLDILKYQSIKNFSETDPLEISGEKGISYIRKQPKTVRSCRNLPVPLQYCICQFEKTAVPNDSEISLKLANTVTNEINKAISDGKFSDKCIKMEFDKTLELEKYNDELNGSILYTIKLRMKKPSEAEFKANMKVSNDSISVLGLVERSNRYGKTADCIGSEYHRPMCYCKKQE
uniref:DUF229 domain containing protein n=1 Tax=Caenorhabditis tropicalis TaxID=1561998 RepID=A0A1I7TNC8_9PELO